MFCSAQRKRLKRLAAWCGQQIGVRHRRRRYRRIAAHGDYAACGWRRRRCMHKLTRLA
jgi:hypothetical protein